MSKITKSEYGVSPALKLIGICKIINFLTRQTRQRSIYRSATKYIIVHDVNKDIKWYVTKIEYLSEAYSQSNWVLGSTLCQERVNALLFTNKEKAVKVAEILSGQIDEYGDGGNYYVDEIEIMEAIKKAGLV